MYSHIYTFQSSLSKAIEMQFHVVFLKGYIELQLFRWEKDSYVMTLSKI